MATEQKKPLRIVYTASSKAKAKANREQTTPRLTLQAGAATPDAVAPDTRAFSLLPPRAEHASTTLRSASTVAIVPDREQPLINFLTMVRPDGPGQQTPVALFGDPTATHAVLAMFSTALQEDAETMAAMEVVARDNMHANNDPAVGARNKRRGGIRAKSAKTRFGDADGPIGNYSVFRALSKTTARPAERELAQIRDFFVRDPYLPEPFQLGDPSLYLMFRTAEAQFMAHKARTRSLLQDGLADVPHVSELPRLSMQYLMRFRMPPRDDEPLCRNQMQCLFKCFDDSGRGYIGKRFNIYGKEDETQLCLDCLLARWAMRAHLNVKNTPMVMHPINTFTVACGLGEYNKSKHVVLGANVESRLSGIFGPVPIYSRRMREFVSLPKHVAQQYGLDPSSARFYLAEVNVGIPKSQPLWDSADRFLATPGLEHVKLWQPVEGLGEERSYAAAAWRTYAARFPHPLLVERAIWRAVPDGPDVEDGPARRLPAIRLRRCLHTAFPPTSTTTTNTTTSNTNTNTTIVLPRVAPRWQSLLDACAARLGLPDHSAFAAAMRDLALCAFEQTLSRAIHDSATADAPLDHCMDDVAAALGTLKGNPLVTRRGLQFSLVRAALWRVIAADFFIQCVLPLAPSYARTTGTYEAYKFADTHLPLLAAAVTYGRDDDAFFYANGGAILTAVYPSAHAVLCAEELPDLSALLPEADLQFDNGRQKKLKSLERALAHLFLNKQMPQKCHVRHIRDKIAGYAQEHPEIETLMWLVVRVSLLGNYPGKHQRTHFTARLRMQLAFADDPVGARPPSTTTASLFAFIDSHRFTILFLMRAFFVYTCEADHTMDVMLSLNATWTDYKKAIQHTNDAIRSELSAQARTNFFAPTRWHDLEESMPSKHKKGGGPPPPPPPVADAEHNVSSSSNRVVTAHAWCLSMSEKNQKGPAEILILRKMIPIERELLAYHTAEAVRQSASLRHLFTTLWPPAQYPDNTTTAWVVYLAAGTAAHAPGEGARAAAVAAADNAAAIMDVLTTGEHAFAALRKFVCDTVVIAPLVARLGAMRHAIHVMARYAIDTMAAGATVLPLTVFQVLQLSQSEVDELRKWFYDYYVNALADNAYKNLALAFGKRSLFAFVIVKILFTLVKSMSQTGNLFLLPAEQALRQAVILRERLRLLPYEPSPPLMGKMALCTGCGRVASILQAAPMWIEQHYDSARMRAQSLVVYQALGKRRATLEQYIAPRVSVGEIKHLFDPRDQQCYCARASYEKTQLRADKAATHARKTGGLHATRESSPLIDTVMERLFSALGTVRATTTNVAEEDEEGEEAEGNHAGGGGGGEGDDDEDDEDLDDLFGMLEVVPAAGTRSTLSTVMRAAAKSTVASPKTTKSRSPFALSMGPLMDAVVHSDDGNTACASEPLQWVDLLGAWYRHQGVVYGLCCICGNLTQVAEHKITNHGLSCMNHAHAEYPADHVHTQAFSAAPHATDALVRHPHVLDGALPCFYCRKNMTRHIVRVFDGMLRLFEVPLCAVDLHVLRTHIPVASLGKPGALAIEPMFVTDLCGELDRAYSRSRAMADRTTTPATARPPGAQDSPSSAMDIEQHPQFNAFMARDDQLRTDYVLVKNRAIVGPLAFAVRRRVHDALDEMARRRH